MKRDPRMEYLVDRLNFALDTIEELLDYFEGLPLPDDLALMAAVNFMNVGQVK